MHVTQSGATYDRSRLFLLSVLALTTTGIVFSIRSSILLDLQHTFFEPYDPLHAAQLATGILGVEFLGFAISIFFGSPLCDFLGMGRLLALSGFLMVASLVVTIEAGSLAHGSSVYTVLWIGMMLGGLARGLVEAVINPLIATIYSDDKTTKLNHLHAWWPGGLIIGGLLGFGLGQGGNSWQIKLGVAVAPALAYGLWAIVSKFPPTERVAANISGGDMLKEAFKPLFIVFACCMLLTASSELAPGQWVDAALTRTVHFQGILLLVYVSALMFVMRHFAGPLAHKLSPVGLLWFSSLLAAGGLYLLSMANSPITGLLAATVWGAGVCYMWPTMLGVVNERFPRGGAFLLGIMGSAGNLAIWKVLPMIGEVFDKAKVQAAQGMGTPFPALESAAKAGNAAAQTKLNDVLSQASAASFRFVALLPLALLLAFGAIWLYDKSKGGYKAVRLSTSDEEEPLATPY